MPALADSSAAVLTAGAIVTPTLLRLGVPPVKAAAAIALAIAASLATGRTVFLDVAIGLALVGFVATIGWARLVQRAPRRTPGAGDA